MKKAPKHLSGSHSYVMSMNTVCTTHHFPYRNSPETPWNVQNAFSSPISCLWRNLLKSLNNLSKRLLLKSFWTCGGRISVFVFICKYWQFCAMIFFFCFQSWLWDIVCILHIIVWFRLKTTKCSSIPLSCNGLNQNTLKR